MSAPLQSTKQPYCKPTLTHFGSMAVKTQGMKCTGGDGSAGGNNKFT